MSKLPVVLVALMLVTGAATAQEATTPVAPAPAPPAATAPAAPAPSLTAPALTAPVAPENAAPQAAAPAVTAPETAPAVTADAPAPAGTSDSPAAAAPGAAPASITGAAPATVTPEPPQPIVHDMSPRGMYEQADWVVKAVMIVLGAAFFMTCTIFLYKTIELFFARARARKSHRKIHAAASLAEAEAALGRRSDPVAVMARAVQEEFNRSEAALNEAGPDGIKERAASLIDRIESQAANRIRRGTGILATVGSVGPFVGLFGTVWGIMNSFIGIAETKTTNLAVVAPGIAEALFATAIGLVAAIPAVVIYNFFSRAIAGYKLALGDAGAAVQRHLSRDIDFRATQEV